MYCSNCGAEINDNAVVCVKCGCAVKRLEQVSHSFLRQADAESGHL